MFKRLYYLDAEGFEICSISGYDLDTEKNAQILYRFQSETGQWKLRSEQFHINEEEGLACAGWFLDYLHSHRQN